jgi:hypothetical protein
LLEVNAVTADSAAACAAPEEPRALLTFNSALIGGAVKAKIRFAGPLRGGRGLDEMRSEIDFEAAISRASATELGEL